MSERSAEIDARGRGPECLPFCAGGLHEAECPVVAESEPATCQNCGHARHPYRKCRSVGLCRCGL